MTSEPMVPVSMLMADVAFTTWLYWFSALEQEAPQ